jgi:glycosyltransferase involved in cell wall biosynthesis
MGGMETYSVELTRELANSVDMEVVALPGRADGSPPHWASLIAFAFRHAFQYMRRKRVPDIIHVGDMAAWPLALVRYGRRNRPLVVLSAHGTDVSYHRRHGVKGRLYGAYLRLGSRMLRKASLIANSAATANAARETGWRASAIVPLGTRLKGRNVPQAHGRHILFAGRLVERKGCRWFAENVLPRLPEDIELHVAGTSWDRKERAILSNPRVKFLGNLGQERLVEQYRGALCVVVPNIELANGEFEGFGLVAAEAAAAGGLVLASACDGLLEAVQDNVTGMLIAPGNAQDWIRRIDEIAAWSKADRYAFIADAMARAQGYYCWERVAKDVLDVLGIYPSTVRDYL